MILVWVTDEDGRWAASVKRRGQQAGRAVRRIKRPPCIKDESLALRVHDLDAAPADLLGPAVDRESKNSMVLLKRHVAMAGHHLDVNVVGRAA